MATTNISTEIVSITGVTAHGASDDFIVSAQKFVAASVPKELLRWAASETVPATHGGDADPQQVTIPTGTDSIISVRRDSFVAQEVGIEDRGFIANSNSLQLATNTFPKYFVADANRIIVKPDPDSTYKIYVTYVDYSNLDDDSDLRDAVVYRACSSEFSKLATAELPTVSIAAVPPDVPTISASTVSFSTTAPSYASPTTTISGVAWATEYPTQASDITTAFTAINAELDETQAVCDELNTNVDAAVTQLGEAATQVDASIDTALGAIVTAAGRINTAVALANDEFDEVSTQQAGSKASPITDAFTQFDLAPALLLLGEADSQAEVVTAYGLLIAAVLQASNAADKFIVDATDSVFGDEDTFLTANSQLTRVKDALDKVSLLIEANKPAANYDAHDLLQTEDLELLQGNLSIVQAEIQRAQMHLQEWVSIGDMRVKEVNAALAEADGQVKVVQTHLQQAQAKREEANSRIASGNAYLQEARASIEAGNSYIQEAQMGVQEVQSYANEVNARIAQIGGYSQVASGYLSASQGFASEIQSKLGIAQGYSQEVQARLAIVPMKVSEYQSKLQDALNEFNDDNAEYQAQLQVSIQNAQMEDSEESKKLQKYATELQQYASEVQSEVSEYQSKLQKQQVIEKEADKYYQWSVNCVTMYIQNNSKMIASTMASRQAGAQA